MTHWRSQKQYTFRASSLNLCLLSHWFFLLLPVELTHLNLLLTIQRQSEHHMLTQEKSNVCAGLDQRSVSELFPVPVYICWRWGNQTSRVFRAQVSHRLIQRHSKGPNSLLYSFPSPASCLIHFMSSEHLANVFMELNHSLLLSVSPLLTSYLPMQGPFPLLYGCLQSLLEIQVFTHPTTHPSLPGPLHPGTTTTSRQITPKTVIWTKVHNHSCSASHHFQ